MTYMTHITMTYMKHKNDICDTQTHHPKLANPMFTTIIPQNTNIMMACLKSCGCMICARCRRSGKRTC